MIPLGFARNTVEGMEALQQAAINRYQPRPRAADMSPDPTPTFTRPSNFPSQTVDDVHQQLQQQAVTTGGVTGNNAPGFPYEVRTQSGENIVPVNLNANDAVAMVNDATRPVSNIIQSGYSKGLARRGQVYGSVRPQSPEEIAQIAAANQAVKSRFVPSADPLGDFLGALNNATTNPTTTQQQIEQLQNQPISPAQQRGFDQLSKGLLDNREMVTFTDPNQLTGSNRSHVDFKIKHSQDPVFTSGDRNDNPYGSSYSEETLPSGAAGFTFVQHPDQARALTDLAYDASSHVYPEHDMSDWEANYASNKGRVESFPVNDAANRLISYAVANRLNPGDQQSQLLFTAGRQGVQESQETIPTQYQPGANEYGFYQKVNAPKGQRVQQGNAAQYLQNELSNEAVNQAVTRLVGDYQPSLVARILSNSPNPNAQVLPDLQQSTPVQDQAMKAAQAVDLINAATTPTSTSTSTLSTVAPSNFQARYVDRYTNATDDDDELMKTLGFSGATSPSQPIQSVSNQPTNANIPYSQIKNVGSIGEAMNPRREGDIPTTNVRPKYHVVIDQNTGTAQPFIDKGQGLQPQEPTSIDKARQEYAFLKSSGGWDTSFEHAPQGQQPTLLTNTEVVTPTSDVQVQPSQPTNRAHFVIDQNSGTAQSFIDQGQGLQPYKTMPIQDARDAYAKAKSAGWGVTFENNTPTSAPTSAPAPSSTPVVVADDNGNSNDNGLLIKTLATGAALGGGVGAAALINNAINNNQSNTPDVSNVPIQPRAHFVIDQGTGTAQSFIDQGQGLQPYKSMSIPDARNAWTQAKQAGWNVSYQ